MSMELQALIEQLEGIAVRVRALDQEAARRLHEEKDREQYGVSLLEKSKLLAALSELIEDEVNALPEKLRREFDEAITEIAEDAMRAMAIGSVFYMSVLLLSEDGRPESPNELEKLIAWLRRSESCLP